MGFSVGTGNALMNFTRQPCEQVRPVQERTAREVFFPCKWLQKYHPELLPPGQGGPVSASENKSGGTVQVHKWRCESELVDGLWFHMVLQFSANLLLAILARLRVERRRV